MSSAKYSSTQNILHLLRDIIGSKILSFILYWQFFAFILCKIEVSGIVFITIISSSIAEIATIDFIKHVQSFAAVVKVLVKHQIHHNH